MFHIYQLFTLAAWGGTLVQQSIVALQCPVFFPYKLLIRYLVALESTLVKSERYGVEEQGTKHRNSLLTMH